MVVEPPLNRRLSKFSRPLRANFLEEALIPLVLKCVLQDVVIVRHRAEF